jgi:hypothetical protein
VPQMRLHCCCSARVSSTVAVMVHEVTRSAMRAELRNICAGGRAAGSAPFSLCRHHVRELARELAASSVLTVLTVVPVTCGS